MSSVLMVSTLELCLLLVFVVGIFSRPRDGVRCEESISENVKQGLGTASINVLLEGAWVGV